MESARIGLLSGPIVLRTSLLCSSGARLDGRRIGNGGRSTSDRIRCRPRQRKSAGRLKRGRDDPALRRRLWPGCGGTRARSGSRAEISVEGAGAGGAATAAASGAGLATTGFVGPPMDRTDWVTLPAWGKQLKAKINVAVPGPVHHTAFAQLLRIEFEPLLLLLPVFDPEDGVAGMMRQLMVPGQPQAVSDAGDIQGQRPSGPGGYRIGNAPVEYQGKGPRPEP